MVMKPPKVAVIMLKLVSTTVGIVVVLKGNTKIVDVVSYETNMEIGNTAKQAPGGVVLLHHI
jgi:hypothetical protein